MKREFSHSVATCVAPRPSPFASSLLPLLSSLLLVAAATTGCSRGPTIAPVSGKVLYNGEPLKFGSVMFQGESGQPARATIQPDGTFELTTDSMGDGARVGTNRVRVTCYEAQDPNAAASAGEAALGKLLIPKKYTDIDTSGIVIDVPPGGKQDLVIELKDETPAE